MTTREVRAALADALSVAMPEDATVYEYPVGGGLEGLTVSVGVPTGIRLDGALSGESVENWPVAVAVASTNSPHDFDALGDLRDLLTEDLPEVLDDPSYPWREASLTRAEFARISTPAGSRHGYLLTITVTR